MLSVRMFGVLTIFADGRRIVEDLGPSGRALSGYLFETAGRVHRRERLADQFWGHLDPERGRAALNTALWRFRRLLARHQNSSAGSNLHTNNLDVVLEPAAWLEIDTLRFTTTIKELLERHRLAEPCMVRLREAVDMYAGPFLEGEDADWILEERERLHSMYIRAASELMRGYGRIERYDEAIAVARGALFSDPFRESLHRDLLILLVLNGQPGEAVRQHERWSAQIKQEIGIRPMPQTNRLIEQIRSGEIFGQLDQLKAQTFPLLAQFSQTIRPSAQTNPLP